MPNPLSHADKFKFLNRVVTNGPFGPVIDWQEGAEFDCLLTFNSSMEARIAEKQQVTSLFSGIVAKDSPIEYHSVFKRVSDDAVFRVTSEPKDDESPGIATFSVKAFTAEKYTLPVS